jgi:LPS-assembly protein
MTATLGEIYRFLPPRVTLNGADNPDRGTSDYIGDVDYALSQHWSLASAVQWSPDSGQFNRSETGVRYHGERARVDVSYRFRRDLLEQADTSFVVPVNDQWKLAGRLRYSTQTDRMLDSFAGVEYQLELKGLTRIGTSYENLLPIEDRETSNRP